MSTLSISSSVSWRKRINTMKVDLPTWRVRRMRETCLTLEMNVGKLTKVVDGRARILMTMMICVLIAHWKCTDVHTVCDETRRKDGYFLVFHSRLSRSLIFYLFHIRSKKHYRLTLHLRANSSLSYVSVLFHQTRTSPHQVKFSSALPVKTRRKRRCC